MKDENQSKNKKTENQKKLTPKELIKKHLENPNLDISEEDIKNLNIGPEADEGWAEKEKEKLDEIKKETGKKPPNPYNILDS